MNNNERLQYLTIDQKRRVKEIGDRLIDEFDKLAEIFDEVNAVYDSKSQQWKDKNGGYNLLILSLGQAATNLAMFQQSIDYLINEH